MIDIKELRRLAQAALVAPDGLSAEWMYRLGQFQESVSPEAITELLDRLEAADRAWKESDKSCWDLTEKVIPNIREQLESAEQERDALRAALEKIADWNGAWGPYPETNEAWRAMALVTAREAVRKEYF